MATIEVKSIMALYHYIVLWDDAKISGGQLKVKGGQTAPTAPPGAATADGFGYGYG